MRLAPDPAMPRSVTPWVGGVEVRDDERRNRLKPGVLRNASSIVTGALFMSSAAVSTVALAGDSSLAAPRDAVTVTVSVKPAG